MMSLTIDSRFHSPNLPVVTLPPRNLFNSFNGVVTEAKSNSILFISFETSLNLVSKFLLPPESEISFCLMLNRR